MPLDQHTALLFIHNMDISIQAKHTYARNIINILRKLGQPHQELTLLDTALRARGALTPISQAKPLLKSDLLKVIQEVDALTARLLMLAWKTASRWDEIQRLEPQSILHLSPSEIVLYFGAETKTSRTRPFRPDLFCVVRGDGTEGLAKWIATAMQGKKRDDKLFPYPTHKLRDVLAPWGYTAHSIKRGALLHVLQALPLGSPLLTIVPLLGKHAPSFPILGDLTVRYAGEQLEVARHLGTGLLTCLL